MKTRYLIFLFTLWGLCSCNESSWLKEEVKDFYAPDNSYTTSEQFRKAANYLYDNLRYMHFHRQDANLLMYLSTDMAHIGTDYPDLGFNNLNNVLTANSGGSGYWEVSYRVIANANIIIDRLETAEQVNETERNKFRGEALFFRGWYYNYLANLYGGVPLVLHEEKEPRRDYIRASRDEVYEQAAKDLREAANLLPDADDMPDGSANKQAAQHVLAEALISLRQWDEAIEAASAVINHPKMALMTQRFGSCKTHEPGDPYWDLFQMNNQNRSTSGNTETIMAFQFEYQNSGSTYGSMMHRLLLPFYLNAKVEGKDGSKVLAFKDITDEKGGRGIGSIQPVNYFFNELWGDDFDKDLRNSSYMIVRDFKIDNPDAKGYGQWIVKDGWLQEEDKIRHFYPFIMKFSPIGQLPNDVYAKNADGSIKTTPMGEKVLNYTGWVDGPANWSYKDEYFLRLGGTYLLRAEAYLGKGEKDKAADDINKLRDRAQASHVSGNDIDIDFILDEYMRELYFETFRMPLLCRLGKEVERARKYNPCGVNVGDHQNLFPIPYSEIERNIFGKIEQNPGY